MAARRSRGDGGVHYSDARERWIATAHVGFSADGKRIVKRVSGRTKTEAKNKLNAIQRDLDDSVGVQGHKFTVEDALRDWLEHGLNGRDPKTIASTRFLIEHRVVPGLGKRLSGSSPQTTSTVGSQTKQGRSARRRSAR